MITAIVGVKEINLICSEFIKRPCSVFAQPYYSAIEVRVIFHNKIAKLIIPYTQLTRIKEIIALIDEFSKTIPKVTKLEKVFYNDL